MLATILLTVLLGNQINEMIPFIAHLRINSFKEYPYLYNGTIESEYEYLEAYKNNQHALVVYNENPNEQGMLIGAPLTAVFSEARTLFELANYSPNYYYYVEEVIWPINKELFSMMFDKAEAQAKEWGYKDLCLITIKEKENHSLKPVAYKSIEPLFKELGFIKTSLAMPSIYSTFCEDGTTQELQHEFIFWIKKLN